ncbi:MAG: LPS assembly protein LptD [Pseudomonadota bacterium]
MSERSGDLSAAGGSRYSGAAGSFIRRSAIGTRNLIKGLSLLTAILFVLLQTNVLMALDSSLEERLREGGDAPWQITAKKLSYVEGEGLYVAEGDVVITRPGQVLSAQRAKYSEKTGIVEAWGDVVLEANGDILRTEEAVFDLNTYQGKMTKGRLFLQENHYYISGDVIEKTGPNTYLVKGCRITTCDGDKADWSITGSEVKVTLEGYGTVKNAVFRIRDVPAFYIPYAIFPAKTKRQTGLLPPMVGYSNRNGLDVEIPFFWAMSDQTDATFYERYMDERGLMQGLEFRYVAEGESRGTFLMDVLSDRIEKKDLSLPEEVDLSPFPRTNETRYWLRGRADQELPLGVEARFDADFLSDQDYLKEFQGGLFGIQGRPDLAGTSGRPVEETQSPTRRSALRLAYDREGYSLQALGSYHQRPENLPDDETAQPFGGLNLDILPRPLDGLPLFLRLDADYDYIWRETGRKGHRASFTPAISYPLWLGPYLEFEPSLSYTGNRQWVDDPMGKGEEQHQEAYDFQARVSTVLERIFDMDWGSAKKLKHKLSPSLIYQYRAPKDHDNLQPWFEPIDVEGKINRVTLSVDNFFDARKENEKGEISYAQWGTFALSQGYDIEDARGDAGTSRKKRPFEPLAGILTLRPFKTLYVDAEARWDYYDEEISYTDVALEFAFERSGGRRDTYALDYEYSSEGIKSLNYRLNVNLLYGFSAGTSQKRDLNVKKISESSYWLDYESQCWGVRLIAGRLDEEESIMIYFRLLGLGEIRGR